MYVRANIEKLDWDSEFFAMPIARLSDVSRPDAPFLNGDALVDYKLVQAKIPAGDYSSLLALQTQGFQVVDGETDFEIRIGDEITDRDDCLLLATESDIPQLKKLAGAAFRSSRFRSPWFNERDNRRFYSVWAEKSVFGTFDECCLILKDVQNEIKGFVTLKRLNDDEARVGLLAVNPNYRKQGVGEQLVKGAMDWSRTQKKRRLRIATQTGNLGAQRLYIKCRATIAGTSYWLYRATQE